MYECILVPTDGSAGMSRVVDHALATARTHDASVHALYVVDSGSVTGIPMEASWEGIARTLEREGERALEAVERRAGAAVEVESTVREGDPSREIVSYVEDHDIDLVVMGTHGRGGIDRLLLGSVAERVVRAAPVPVTTVRLGSETGSARIVASDPAPQDETSGDRDDASGHRDEQHAHDRPDHTPEPEPEPGAR